MVCKEPDCDREAKARGWCGKHYLRWWKHGDPTKCLINAGAREYYGTDEERFWRRVTKTNECWIWSPSGRWPTTTSAKTSTNSGYGVITINGKQIGAHKASWQLHYGPIPSGKCVLHTCDNRRCVRPEHLFLGTRSTNNKDAAAKNKIMRRVIRILYTEGRLKKEEIALLGDIICFGG